MTEPTICKCGLAKSYHPPNTDVFGSLSHDYEPRYEPMAYRQGRADALREAAERVRALPTVKQPGAFPISASTFRDAVLALLQAEPTPREVNP